MKNFVVATLAAALIVSSNAHAQRPADVAEFDVSGVTLGMTHEQVVTALQEKGFSISSTSEQADWETLLVAEAKKRGYEGNSGGRIAGMTRARGPQDESIDVWYAATPQGARVANINYHAKPERITREAFLSGLQSKYGIATTDNGARKIYCTMGEKKCTPLFGSDRLPHLKVQMDPALLYSIDLSEGREAKSRRRAQFATALEAYAPKSSRTTF
ncbi:MAG: hypothetical protein VX454_11205 [Pseudomonadota bacterium]|nr:hypothetical protein [Pseudomonadota bacterium]